MSQQVDAAALRRAILDSLPMYVFAEGAPDPRFLYLPTSHIRALDPDSMLVVGARGTGKSFWWNALQDPATRSVVSDLFPSRSHKKLDVVGGWGEGSQPGFDVLRTLLSADARLVWKAIVLEKLVGDFFQAEMSWKERLSLIQSDPERVERQLVSVDETLLKKGTRKLVLFDALDKVASTWEDRNQLLKGLFQLILEFRYSRSIRLKAFVRADVVNNPTIREFPDASKLLHARVELTWSKVDLYGLFWQHLGNASPGGEVVRRLVSGWSGDRNRYQPPEKLAKDENTQRDLFTRLAGEKMGGGPKRGRPYQWVPNHLADGHGQTTPRSFLAALRTAAEETSQDHHLALDWKAIQEGVRKASDIRVQELQEDFAWMQEVMEPLVGLSVPCEEREILTRWKNRGLIRKIRDMANAERASAAKLSPGFEQGEKGLLHDLEQLGILDRRGDDRINVPDLYRIKFGLKRRGGVRPMR